MCHFLFFNYNIDINIHINKKLYNLHKKDKINQLVMLLMLQIPSPFQALS